MTTSLDPDERRLPGVMDQERVRQEPESPGAEVRHRSFKHVGPEFRHGRQSPNAIRGCQNDDRRRDNVKLEEPLDPRRDAMISAFRERSRTSSRDRGDDRLRRGSWQVGL